MSTVLNNANHIITQKHAPHNLKKPVNPMVEYALAYATLGIPVIALWWPTKDGKCACWREKCDTPGKHPITDKSIGLKSKKSLMAEGITDVKGFEHLATTDPERIRQIWGKYPYANIGLLTGSKSGFFTLDFDTKKEAMEFLEDLKANCYGGNMPDTVITQTGSGGYHVHFKYPDWFTVDRNSVGQIALGVDIRTDGGLTVAPPSLHYSGNRYEWLPDHSPFEKVFGEVPEWLANLLRTKQQKAVKKAKKEAEQGKVWESYLNKFDVIYDGARNDTLFREIACSMQAKGASDADIWATLKAINETKCRDLSGHLAPIDESELRAIFQSAISRYEKGKKPEGKAYPLSDYGNAERLIDRHGTDIRFSLGSWFIWDGTRWVFDETGHIYRKAKDTVRAMREEFEELEGFVDEKTYAAMMRFVNKSESWNGINHMIKMASSEPGIIITHEYLDTNHYLLNVLNGTIDLRTGELREHRRDDYITKLAPVMYNPNAKAPTWEKFLNDIFAGDQELIKYMQRVIGYSLTGDTSEDAYFILYGDGANGKSTFLETIQGLLGDYAQTAPPSLVTAKTQQNNGANNDVARLRGARFVSASETEQGARLAEALIKRLTGGDTLTARFLNKEFFEFKAICKLFIATNYLLNIKGTDKGIWRRTHLVPFTVEIPKEKQDKHLDEKLSAEWPGILNWALEGTKDWLRLGDLKPPAAVVNATAEYRWEMDVLGQFLDMCIERKPGERLKVDDLYQTYKYWANQSGIDHAMTKQAFNKKLKERGFVNRKANKGMYYWFDIALTEEGKAYHVHSQF